MLKAFFGSREWLLWAWLGAALILFSIYGQVTLTVMINEWYGEFYDILQKPLEFGIDAFWDKLIYFLKLAMP